MSSKIYMRALTDFATTDNRLITENRIFAVDSGEGAILEAKGKATKKVLAENNEKMAPRPANKMRAPALNK